MSKANEVVKLAYEKGYRVSHDGLNIVSPSGFVRKCWENNKGYLQCSVRADEIYGKRQMKCYYVHRLAAYQKFGDSMFDSGVEVRHVDGNNQNNVCGNIKMGTSRENSLDIPKEKRLANARHAASYLRKRTDSEEGDIVKFYNKTKSYKEVNDRYNIPKSTFYCMLRRINKAE